jgi:hypothetical protein
MNVRNHHGGMRLLVNPSCYSRGMHWHLSINDGFCHQYFGRQLFRIPSWQTISLSHKGLNGIPLQPTSNAFLDLLCGPVPEAFAGCHRAIDDYKNRVAQPGTDDDLLPERPRFPGESGTV